MRFTKFFLLFAGLVAASVLQAQRIHYHFSAPNAVHHEAIVQLKVEDMPKGPAIFRMSRSSPGRYATHEFGKNIYQLKAVDEKGQPLTLLRTDADVYEVRQHNGNIRLQYTLYGNHADGTYASIDATGYHLNMPATFLWLQAYDDKPISLQVAVPEGSNWTVATQLIPGNAPNSFTAPGLQYFLDSPVKVGDLKYRSWQVTDASGKTQEIRIAFDTEASEAQLDSFAGKVKKLVQECSAVFGEFPNFENNRYTFLASLNPYVVGDGMEHRNSTMITLPVQADGIDYALGTFSHEFFHAWNVERIRPKSIEPFDFRKSNMSEGLWVAEGFTQYYGELLMTRAKLSSEEEWLANVAGFINTKLHRPGGRHFTVIENSQQAVFTDAGTSVDKTNFGNIFSSYYVTGAATALALDLDLRIQFNKSLDDYMQALWTKHGKTELPYTLTDLEAALATTTGDAAYAKSFFANHVYGVKPFDYAGALKAMGISTRVRESGKGWMGQVGLEEKNNKLVVSSNSVAGTPWYGAGIDINDELLRVDGLPIRKEAEFTNWLASKKPGDTATIEYLHRGKKKQAQVVFGEQPDILLSIDDGAAAAAAQMRSNWISSKAKR